MTRKNFLSAVFLGSSTSDGTTKPTCRTSIIGILTLGVSFFFHVLYAMLSSMRGQEVIAIKYAKRHEESRACYISKTKYSPSNLIVRTFHPEATSENKKKRQDTLK